MVCAFTVAYPKETRRIPTESNERKLPQREKKRLTVMLDFGPPLSLAHIAVAWKRAPHLGPDVFEGWRGDNREAQQEYVGLGVAEWTQAAGMSAVSR